MSHPHIAPDSHGIPTLYVNGRPFFLYSGEIHNSAASSLAYMEEHVWPNLENLNMNAVILPIFWELLEPAEGQFDFTLTDGLITQARRHEKKLVLLWFGLWKNAESMYVPQWMKKDTKTYFRAETVRGEKTTTISPFCKAAVEKDAYAFAALMDHIRAFDEEESTVLVIQVENEIGILGEARDYCQAAQKFPKSLKRTFTWKAAGRKPLARKQRKPSWLGILLRQWKGSLLRERKNTICPVMQTPG